MASRPTGESTPSKLSWLGSYCKETIHHPIRRMAKDNQSIFGRSWQVAWIIALVVAGLCIGGAAKDLGTTDYIKKLFEQCKVFEASCYISLGLFVTYVLGGRSGELNLWSMKDEVYARQPEMTRNAINAFNASQRQQMFTPRKDIVDTYTKT